MTNCLMPWQPVELARIHWLSIWSARVSAVEIGERRSMDDNVTNNDELNPEGPDGPSVPTEEQAKLRRRYGRMMGWYGAFALLFLSLAVYNVTQGLNAFGSAPMLVELLFGVGFSIPAIWAYRRSKRLDGFVEQGSPAMPRHLKTWQHMLVLVVGVPVAFMAASTLVGLIIASSMPPAPSADEIRAEEMANLRQAVLASLDNQPLESVRNICENLSEPGGPGTFRRLMSDITTQPNSGELSAQEVIDVYLRSYLEYCGLR